MILPFVMSLFTTASPWMGLVLGEATPTCIYIAAVVADSPAWRAGLRSGDCLTGVDGERVELASRAQELLTSTTRKHVLVLVGDRRIDVESIDRPANADELACAAVVKSLAILVENGFSKSPDTDRTRLTRPQTVRQILATIGVKRTPEVVVHVLFDRGCGVHASGGDVWDARDAVRVGRSARVRVIRRTESSPLYVGPDGRVLEVK